MYKEMEEKIVIPESEREVEYESKKYEEKKSDTLKLKIGQEIIIKEDFEIESALGKEKIMVKKGDKGVVTSSGFVQYTTGKARGKMQKLQDIELKDHDTENIASLIYQRLASMYNLKDLLDDWDIDKKDFISEIDYVLSDIL